MKRDKHIPKSFNVGGQRYEVRNVQRSENNNVGASNYCGGFVEIAEFFNKDEKQSDGCKVNTFYHELIHIILDNMGEKELSCNERFVSTFAGFLTEAMTTAEFDIDTKDTQGSKGKAR